MVSIPSQSIIAKPFLKWAGGKTQLLPEIQSLLDRVLTPESDWTYIEPFVGGGAVLFHILEHFPCVKRAVINDINPELVAAYQTLRDDLDALLVALSALERTYLDCPDSGEKKRFYLKKREEFNRLKRDPHPDRCAQTALLIFLNKTCFNGLYRVNRQGEFNVPFGERKYLPRIHDRENLTRCHDCLQKVKIERGDFETMLNYAGKNALYYLDPPYKPLNTTSSFTAYTREDFNDCDQRRVKAFCDRARSAGAALIVSNSDAIAEEEGRSFFEELYEGYAIKRVRAKRQINCKADSRGAISELLISHLPL